MTNWKIASIIITFIVLFFGMFWVIAISNADINITYKVELDNNTQDSITALAFSAQEISEHAQIAIFNASDCTSARNNTELWCDRTNGLFIVAE